MPKTLVSQQLPRIRVPKLLSRQQRRTPQDEPRPFGSFHPTLYFTDRCQLSMFLNLGSDIDKTQGSLGNASLSKPPLELLQQIWDEVLDNH